MIKVLLMPSAKLAPPELQSEFGSIPSAMIPLDSRPAFRYIAEPFVRDGYQVVLAIHEEGAQVSGYLERHPDLDARTIDVGPTGSLGETVLAALDGLGVVPERLVINFADTYVGDPLPAGNVVCCRRQADVYRWTVFELTADQRIAGVVDKDQDKAESGDTLVFVGVFAFDRPGAFRSALRRAVAARRPDQVDPFYTAVVEYFNRLAPDQKVFLPVRDWRDFGHVDTYYAAKQQFFLNKRFFNRVHIDTARGVVRKSSADTHKLTAELNWYLRLPKGLRHVAPRVLDCDSDPENCFLEAEFYSYPVLSDVYLFGACNIGVWNQALQALHRVIGEMGAYRLVPAESGALERALREMYEEKTSQRLQPLVGDARFARFWADEVVINGQPCLGLGRVLERLPDAARELGLYSSRFFTVIHGDLCLSNILYDPRNRLVRLIDPRGSFGPYDIYGDPRYDLAKLCHSLEGDYDFLVHDLFDLRWHDHGLEWRPHTDHRHAAVKSLFRKWMRQHWAAEYPAIQLIESLLFLSMVPLHADRFDAQQAFLAQGLSMFTGLVTGLPAPDRSAGTPVPAPGGGVR